MIAKTLKFAFRSSLRAPKYFPKPIKEVFSKFWWSQTIFRDNLEFSQLIKFQIISRSLIMSVGMCILIIIVADSKNPLFGVYEGAPVVHNSEMIASNKFRKQKFI